MAQGLPYYYRFISRFPEVKDLALASEDEILRLWQGLGYYSRARNLHATAKTIYNENGSTFPDTYKGLLKLKGVGEYTAAAIASFAFKEKVAVVDGNVIRVLSRVFGIEKDVSAGAGRKEIREIAEELIPEEAPDLFNQGVMEFGALHCTPSSPGCDSCIFSVECYARRNKKQKTLPLKAKKIRRKKRFFHYLIVTNDNGEILMKKRNDQDIWKGLYEFPTTADLQLDVENTKEPEEEYIKSSYIKHILSHQEIYASFKKIRSEGHEIPENTDFYTIEEITKLPKHVLINNYLEKNIF